MAKISPHATQSLFCVARGRASRISISPLGKLACASGEKNTSTATSSIAIDFIFCVKAFCSFVSLRKRVLPPPFISNSALAASGLGPSSPLHIYLQFRTPSINWIYLVQRIILVCGNLFTKNSVLKRGALKRKRNWILLVLYCSVRKENPAKKRGERGYEEKLPSF